MGVKCYACDDDSCSDECLMNYHETVGQPQIEFPAGIEQEDDDCMCDEGDQTEIH